MNSAPKNDLSASMFASCVAGGIARCVCHPLDTIKSRLQFSVSVSSFVDVCRTTMITDGIRGFYRGLGVATIGGIPGVCIYLTSYETSKNILSNNLSSQFLSYFLSGMVAESACGVFFVPVDVIKERMQVQQRMNIPSSGSGSTANHLYYSSAIDAVKKIMASEGIRGVYKGYGATLIAYGPFSACYFLFYEQLKKFHGTELSFVNSLAYSALSGGVASYITNPLDLIKLRLQVQRGVKVSAATTAEAIPPVLDARFEYSGFGDGLKKVYRHEGIKGLFKGANARVLFHAPSTAITMALYEECKKIYMR